MWGQRNQSDRTIRRIESITSLEDSQRKGSLMSESVVQLSENTFDEEISSATEPILVDFWAEWCGPCKQIGPALEELSAEYGERINLPLEGKGSWECKKTNTIYTLENKIIKSSTYP